MYYRSEGRVPNGIFDPWVRWDGGLDSARNSSAAAVAAAVALQAGSIFWENKRAIFWYNKSWFSEKIRALIFYACTPKLIWGLSSRRINTAKMTAILARYFLIFTPKSDYHVENSFWTKVLQRKWCSFFSKYWFFRIIRKDRPNLANLLKIGIFENMVFFLFAKLMKLGAPDSADEFVWSRRYVWNRSEY